MNKRRGVNHPPRVVKDAVIQRDGRFCLLALNRCQGEATTTDHRANRQAGGSRLLNHPGVLVAACERCNGDKADAHAIVLFELEQRGLYVRPAATHAKTLERALSTPVQDLAGDWWMLLSSRERRPATDAEIARHLEWVGVS